MNNGVKTAIKLLVLVGFWYLSPLLAVIIGFFMLLKFLFTK